MDAQKPAAHKESDSGPGNGRSGDGMVMGKRAVFGIYDSESSADRATDTLTKSDFAISEVSVLVPVSPDGGANKMSNGRQRASGAMNSRAGFDGTLGLLSDFRANAIPGIGPTLSAGQLVNSLRGMDTGSSSGQLAEALILLGVQEVVAKRYEGRLKDGKVLLSIHCDTPEEITQAKELMEGAGGEDVTSTGEVFANPAKTPYRTVSAANR